MRWPASALWLIDYSRVVRDVAVAILLITAFVLLPLESTVLAVTSNFQQTINAGTLAVDITDSSYVTVGSPSVVFGATTFSFACGSSTGTLGTSSQQIYVQNPDAADSGWSVAIAGSATTAVWDGAASDFDFNDPTSTGCGDGADADSVAGQMSIAFGSATFDKGACLTCNTTGVAVGSSGSFSEGVTNSITLFTGASNSSDIGDWYLRGVGLTQTIPAEQAAASDYDINMNITITAS